MNSDTQAECPGSAGAEEAPSRVSVHPSLSFNRKLSTPADFKPSMKQPNRGLEDLDDYSMKHKLRYQKQHRRSYDDVSRGYNNHQDIHTASSDKSSKAKPVSPSSSSMASDSAFSQSQSTLESEESSPTNSFRESISGKRDSIYPLEANNNIEVEDDDNQFKIIWRNLTFQVPTKRFSKIRRLWSGSEIDPSQISASTIALSSQTVSQRPMKASAVAKPRQVIFENLNGCIQSGRLTAILGPSGAGKTTFLKCLTNSIVKGVSGSIEMVDGTKSTERRRLKLCIIPQKGEYFLYKVIS